MSRLFRLSADGSTAIISHDNSYSVLDVESNTVLSTDTEMPMGLWETPTRNQRSTFLPILAALSPTRRRDKVKDQPRDHQGRWVAAGANVKWRSNNQIFSGTVDAIKDGKAIVSVKNPDGTVSQTTLKPSTLQVMATKARLSSKKGKEFHDPDSDTKKYIANNRDEIEKAADEEGAIIRREDGYSLTANRRNRDSDPTNDIDDKQKPKVGNPLIYQLYAPNGKSLGVFGPAGEDSFDSVIASDKGETTQVVVSSGVVYPIKDSVKEAVLSYAENNLDELSDGDLSSIASLCSDEPVSEKDIILFLDLLDTILGNTEEEVYEDPEPTIEHNFMDDTYSYFVYGDYGTDFVGLIAVDELRDKVYGWTGTEFGLELGPIQNFDAEIIESVDAYTAYEIANLLHSDSNSTFSLVDIFPEERNLFTMALPEMDLGLLDNVAKFTYNSGERSLDAQAQARGEGGKFGKVEDNTSENSLGGAKYFAIVDDIDPTSVMDVVAIVNKDGIPTAFKRLMGQWVPDAEMLQKLSGATPPPVSALNDEVTIKEVLSQVDEYDSGKEDPVTASGISVDDLTDIKTVDDLYLAVYSAVQEPTAEDRVRNIVKRAKALNRIDVVPEDWRITYSTDFNTMYGEFGEVITASANSSSISALDRLEEYWLTTDKIDWTSSSAVSFAADQLTKYLGRPRATAFATILHTKANTL